MVQSPWVSAASVGAGWLWKRSQFYRKQAALCAYFEQQHTRYVSHVPEEWSPEEKLEYARLNNQEILHFASLKEHYRRVARRPWEALPSDAPVSVNAWDLGELSASELEQMVKDHGGG